MACLHCFGLPNLAALDTTGNKLLKDANKKVYSISFKFALIIAWINTILRWFLYNFVGLTGNNYDTLYTD